MSVEAITWALKQRTGSSTTKHVLIVLANYANEDAACFPSQKLIGEQTELSERAIRTALNALEEGGFIRRENRRRRDGSRSSDLIVLCLDGPVATMPRAKQPAEFAACESDNRHDVPGVPAPGAATTGTSCRGILEPSLEPSPLEDADASLSDGSASDRRRRIVYPEGFQALWSAYPTDALMSKKAALAAWKRLDEDDRTAALASCDGFREHCRKNPKYRPVHLVRYLSERRFDGFTAAQPRAERAGVFVVKDSPDWRAWQAVKRTPAIASDATGEVGWWFPAAHPSMLERSEKAA